jgi:hydrogenase-4 membrane subunit HyfE
MLQHYGPQLINLLAAVLLLLAFAMLSQRRILSLINLFAAQGVVLFLATVLVAFVTHQGHLYWSAGLTLVLKVLSFLMMITRSKAVPQVVGFLSMENGLFFAATAAVYGMPMVVELGVALDVLVASLILGVFLFQIRERFDSVDTRHLEKLKEH